MYSEQDRFFVKQMVKLRSGVYINTSLIAAIYQVDDDEDDGMWEVSFAKCDEGANTLLIDKDEYEELDRKLRERFDIS